MRVCVCPMVDVNGAHRTNMWNRHERFGLPNEEYSAEDEERNARQLREALAYVNDGVAVEKRVLLYVFVFYSRLLFVGFYRG